MSDQQKEDWFCSSFPTMPDLCLLSEYRKVLSSQIPMFFSRNASDGHIALYLPPGAKRFVSAINGDRKLRSFGHCHKPADDGRLRLLFGDDADFAEHFPLSAQGVAT